VVLDEVCRALGYHVAEDSKKDYQNFLSVGGTGKVFRVVKNSDGGNVSAVKIVVGEVRVKLLRQEKAILEALRGSHVAVELKGFYEIQDRGSVDFGAGLIMEPVGTPISMVKNPKKYFPDALRILSRIHMLGAFHGDPRTHNILLHEGSVIFCDFQIYAGLILGAENKAKVMQDLEIIFESFDVKIADKVLDPIDQYATSQTLETIEKVIQALP
jgi:hypothetical protein